VVIIFFDYEDVMLHEYALQGQTINQQFYLEVLNVFMMQHVVNSYKNGNPASYKFIMTEHLPTQPSLCGTS
jgi:hypothetical protein